jgi:hypothetical protein
MKSIKTVDEHGAIRYENEDGQYHREDGPAIEWSNGYKAWLINGQYHREDGPARIWPDGTERYYLNNKWRSKEDWEQEVFKNRLNRIKDL